MGRFWGWRTWGVAAGLLVLEMRLLQKLLGGVGVIGAEVGSCAPLVGVVAAVVVVVVVVG